MLKMKKCLMPTMVALVVVISPEWSLPIKSSASVIFGILPLVVALRNSNIVSISSYMPLRCELHLLPSILSSQVVLSVNGIFNLWSFTHHPLITISILSWSSIIPPNGLKPFQRSIKMQLLHPSFSLTMLSVDLGFWNNWSLTMTDTLKMRYGVIYSLFLAMSTNIHPLTTPKEMSKLKLLTKSLRLCFNGQWINIRPTGILCSSLPCGPIELMSKLPLGSPLSTSFSERKNSYQLSVKSIKLLPNTQSLEQWLIMLERTNEYCHVAFQTI